MVGLTQRVQRRYVARVLPGRLDADCVTRRPGEPLTIPGDATVGHYDREGRWIAELLHVDGTLVRPLDLGPGESLWMAVPGRPGLQHIVTRPV